MSTPDRVDGGPAFPVAIVPCGFEGHDLRCRCDSLDGISARDYFAAKALIGILSNPSTNVEVFTPNLSKLAFEHADAMLAERRKA